MWALDYRPKTFEEVIGQEQAITTLKNSKDKSTTFILHGASGVGKTTLARIYANSINGEAIEINGADNNGVDDIRALISSASYIPAFNDYRVFIIDECHMLTTSAWNALLKILEESPKTTLWMLCTTEYSKIPTTIKSRSTDVKLKHIGKYNMQTHLEHILKKEGKTVPNEVIVEIIASSEGRLREAITTLETYVNTGTLSLNLSTIGAIKFLTSVFKGDVLDINKQLSTINNADIVTIVRIIDDYLKLMLIRPVLPKTVTTEELLDTYTSISSVHINEMRILQEEIWKCVDSGQDQLKGSIELMYNFYDSIMKHYNDFRDAKASFEIAIYKQLGDLNG